MHIAICDDNVADRKHLERLLSRESDKRAGTPNILYIESFGKKENLLKNPLKYDLFFIDMVSSSSDAKELVLELMRIGVNAPIIMYSSIIDYSLDNDLPDTVVHMKKPYIPDPLPELLKLGDEHVLGTVPTVAFSIDGLRKFFPVNDIYYVLSKDEKSQLFIRDNNSIIIDEPIVDVLKILEPYPEFYYLNRNTIFNVKYTMLITPITIMMQDYKEFRYGFWKYSEILDLKDKVERYL